MSLMFTEHLIGLARIARRVGWRIPTWVQGAGGNVSLKAEKDGLHYLLVKASGIRLDQVTPSNGIAAVDVNKFAKKFNFKMSPSNNFDLEKSEAEYVEALRTSQITLDGKNKSERPSMETGFHLALSAKVVVHHHSLPAILMAYHLSDEPTLKPWLERQVGGKVVLVPPLMPGRELSSAIYEHRDAKVILLSNHGIILGLQDIREISNWENVEQKFLSNYGYHDLLNAWTSSHRENLANQVKSAAIPLKFYLPDTAVFAKEIESAIIPQQIIGGETFYILNSQRRDLIELWAAQQLLYASCPRLSTLPDSIVNRIRTLPTEQYRIKKLAS